MDPVIVLSGQAATSADGVALAQFKLRCPHCGYEWVANLYDRGGVSSVDWCPTCEDEADPAPVTGSALFAQLPVVRAE